LRIGVDTFQVYGLTCRHVLSNKGGFDYKYAEAEPAALAGPCVDEVTVRFTEDAFEESDAALDDVVETIKRDHDRRERRRDVGDNSTSKLDRYILQYQDGHLAYAKRMKEKLEREIRLLRRSGRHAQQTARLCCVLAPCRR
jgi:hypothetical protein